MHGALFLNIFLYSYVCVYIVQLFNGETAY